MNFKKLPIITIILFISFHSISFNDLSSQPAKKTVKAVKEKKKKKKWVKKFALNFQNVEIAEFLNVMSQLIGKNIIMDDKVRGKISISSAKKVPVSQAYDIMKSILEVKGMAVIETENLIKVIPIKEAIQKNVEIIVDGKKQLIPTKEKTITFLLEINNADANEIAGALKSLKSQFTNIVLFRTLNIIILSGKSTEIDGLVKIAKALDKQIGEDDLEKIAKGNIHVIHLENSDAEQLAGVLSRVPFSSTAKIDTTPLPRQTVRPSNKARRVTRTQPVKPLPKSKLSIIANKETNSLIVTATPEEYREIRRIIKELDIVREQVLIEALILEVTAENGWGFGIDWMLGNQTGRHIYGGSSIMGNPANYSSLMDAKNSAVPLLYLPDIQVYPSQLNGDYTFKNYGDPDILVKHGYWSEELADRWLGEADFVLLQARFYDEWYRERLKNGAFEELESTPPSVYCEENTHIRIFKRVN